MNPFTFQTTPNVLFEAGAAAKIAEIVASYGAKRVMLVTDKGVRNAGLTRSAEDALTKAGVSLSVFEDVRADPPAQVIEAAAKRARSENADLVLSIGGGSALDTAAHVGHLANRIEPLVLISGVGVPDVHPLA